MLPLSALPLNALRAVEAVGRLGSLAAASSELNITVSAVSQHLQKAEERLGVSLFDRASGNLALTDSGRALLPRLTSGFGEIGNGVAALQRDDGRVLTVTMGPAFASGWFVPRLSRFTQAHPDLQLRLVASVDVIDLARSDIDVAIRLGTGEWTGLHCEHLLDQSIFPVATPDWASQVGSPADLAHVPAIQDAGSSIGWADWFVAAGVANPPRLNGPIFSDPVLAFEATLAGQGAMLAWSLIASDALADGRLVRPFNSSISANSAYWFVSTVDKARRPKVRALREWLAAELQASKLILQGRRASRTSS